MNLTKESEVDKVKPFSVKLPKSFCLKNCLSEDLPSLKFPNLQCTQSN